MCPAAGAWAVRAGLWVCTVGLIEWATDTHTAMGSAVVAWAGLVHTPSCRVWGWLVAKAWVLGPGASGTLATLAKGGLAKGGEGLRQQIPKTMEPSEENLPGSGWHCWHWCHPWGKLLPSSAEQSPGSCLMECTVITPANGPLHPPGLLKSSAAKNTGVPYKAATGACSHFHLAAVAGSPWLSSLFLSLWVSAMLVSGRGGSKQGPFCRAWRLGKLGVHPGERRSLRWGEGGTVPFWRWAEPAWGMDGRPAKCILQSVGQAKGLGARRPGFESGFRCLEL